MVSNWDPDPILDSNRDPDPILDSNMNPDPILGSNPDPGPLHWCLIWIRIKSWTLIGSGSGLEPSIGSGSTYRAAGSGA